jgi:Protein of unknown function (DUF2800)
MTNKIPRASFFYPMDNCDAAWELSQASGEEPPTVYAEKGTRGHSAMAGRLGVDALSLPEQKDVETISRRYSDQLADWLAGDKVTEIISEEEFAYRVRLKPVYNGHPDKVVFAGPERAFIPDFKFSWQPLNGLTATNRQLMAYVPLVKQRYPALREIRTSIIPLTNKVNPPADYLDQDMKRAEIWALSVVDRATAAGKKSPNAGPWCQYCSGKVLCPIWQAQIPEIADAPGLAAETVSDDVLRAVAPRLKVAAKVIDRLLDRLEQRVREAPELFPDWTFEPGRNRRHIDDPAKAWKAVRDRLSPDEFIAACSLSVVSLEEAYYRRFGGTRKESDAALAELLKGLTRIKRSKASLIYDPKPAETDGTSQPELVSLFDSGALPAPAA